MTSWADIQRLASDLQRVQLSQSSKKLSEANCIEVITKLIGNSQINVVFTRDGHSYVTKKHLETEVKNECIARDGRVPLTEVAASLNIDYDHVERTAKLVVSQDKDFTLSNAELFSTEYVHRLRNELRELLEENGYQTTSALCKHWELSPELLQSLLIEQLPADFQGVVDGDTIYTESYLKHRKFILAAVLSAIIKVTPISTIQKRVGLTQKRFWIAFDELSTKGQVPGRIVGSKTSPACVYLPNWYENLVKTCVSNSLRQDEYIQTKTLKKLGIDGKSGLEGVIGKKETGELIQLNSIYLKKSLLESCITTIEEDLEKNGISEVRLALQTLNIPLENEDEDGIAEKVGEKVKDVNVAEGFVFKSTILTEALKSIAENIESKAHQEVDRLEKEKKQGGGGRASKAAAAGEDDDWGDGKKGGKGGKKGGKGKGSQAGGGGGSKGSSASAAGGGGNVAVTEEELEEWLRNAKCVPEEILTVAVEKLTAEATAELRRKVAEISATQLTANAASTKKSLTQMAEKIKHLYDSFCTFETATTSFADPLGGDLRTFLLKSVGVELANAILSYASGVENCHQMKEKQRDETIESLGQMQKEPIKNMFAALKSTDDSTAIDTFHDAIYDCSTPSATSLSLRKADKKTRIEIGQKLIEELKQQVESNNEPATSLLLIVLYLLAKNGRPTTASGKFVAQLIAQMKDDCSEEVSDLLSSCQKGVVNCIKNKDDDVSKEMLNTEMKQLKQIVLQL